MPSPKKKRMSLAKALTIALAASSLRGGRGQNVPVTTSLNALAARTAPSYNAASVVRRKQNNVLRTAAKNLNNLTKQRIARTNEPMRFPLPSNNKPKKTWKNRIRNQLYSMASRLKVSELPNTTVRETVTALKKIPNNATLVRNATAAGLNTFKNEKEKAFSDISGQFDTVVTKYLPLIRSENATINEQIKQLQPDLKIPTTKFRNTYNMIMWINHPDVVSELTRQGLEMFGMMKGRLEGLVETHGLNRIDTNAERSVKDFVKDHFTVTASLLKLSEREVQYLIARTEGALENSHLWKFLGVGPLNKEMWLMVISMTCAHLASVVGDVLPGLFRTLVMIAVIYAAGLYGTKKFYPTVSYVMSVIDIRKHPRVARITESLKAQAQALKGKAPTAVINKMWKPMLNLRFALFATKLEKAQKQREMLRDQKRAITKEIRALERASSSNSNANNKNNRLNTKKENLEKLEEKIADLTTKIGTLTPQTITSQKTAKDRALEVFFVLVVLGACCYFVKNYAWNPKQWAQLILWYGRLLGY